MRALVVGMGIGIGIGLGAGVVPAGADVLRFPDGSWIGRPVAVEAAPLPAVSPRWHDSWRPDDAKERFRAEIGEEKTLLRRLYEGLPPGVAGKIPSAPAAPRRTTVSSPVDRILVFPTGNGWPAPEARHAYAWADRDGNVGSWGDGELDDRVPGMVHLPGVVPRLSPEISLLAWKLEAGEYRIDFSRPPVARMTFRNPLQARPETAPAWPDGKEVREQTWRGRTLRLERATRATLDRPGPIGRTLRPGVDFDFKVSGTRTENDFEDNAWHLEDNRGNVFWPTSRGYSWGLGSWSIGTTVPALWPDNPNWRLTLWLRADRLGVLQEGECRRFRHDHPRGEPGGRVLAERVEVNGAVLRNLRIGPDPKPDTMREDPEGFARWYVPAQIEFEVETLPPGSELGITGLHDGVVPFPDRRRDVATPRIEAVRPGGTGGRIRVAIDREAEFLEFALFVSRWEPLEFYFQPELFP
jgi:hypothetical protein